MDLLNSLAARLSLAAITLGAGLFAAVLGLASSITLVGAEFAVKGTPGRAALVVVGASLAGGALITLVRQARRGQPNSGQAQLPMLTAALPQSPAPSVDKTLFTFDDQGAVPISELIRGSEKVSVLVRTGVNVLGQYERMFKEAMATGCEVRIILLDPQSPTAEHAYTSNKQRYKMNHESARDYVARLQSLKLSGKIELRLCKEVPPFSLLIARRSDLANSVLVVQINMYHGAIGRDRPIFYLNGNDRWYNCFVTEFEEAWKNSVAAS